MPCPDLGSITWMELEHKVNIISFTKFLQNIHRKILPVKKIPVRASVRPCIKSNFSLYFPESRHIEDNFLTLQIRQQVTQIPSAVRNEQQVVTRHTGNNILTCKRPVAGAHEIGIHLPVGRYKIVRMPEIRHSPVR
jgi:ABC-type Fe2+-enterobactin transport system substrate-binding protein